MSRLAQRCQELRAAVMLLTRLPVGQLRDPAPSMAATRWAFPLVGALVGAMCWGVFTLLQGVGVPPTVCAFAALGVGALATGGLHHDGLADLADGLGGGSSRARKLEIMRDSRIGSYGVLALILVLATKAAAIAELQPGLWTFALIGAVSRTSMVFLLAFMPSARSDGLGHMAASAGRDGLNAAAAIILLICIPFGWGALALLIASALGAGIIAWWAYRQIGGQTGDVLGAAQQCASLFAWVAVSALT